MKDKIYEVYKSLAGLGITAAEINGIADAYKKWLTCPKGSGTAYGNVYYHNGKLCSIPYYPVIDELHYKLVGIEINGVIYLKGYEMNIGKSSISEVLNRLKDYVFNDRVCANSTPEFKIELPTFKEIDILQKQIHSNFNADLNLCAIYGKYWVCSGFDKDIKPAMIAQLHSQIIENLPETTAIVVPVVHFQANTFIGAVDDFGIPSDETTKIYQDLCEFALNS